MSNKTKQNFIKTQSINIWLHSDTNVQFKKERNINLLSRILYRSCRYSALNEEENNSLILRYGLQQSGFLPEKVVWKRGKKSNLTVEKTESHYFSEEVNVSISTTYTLDKVR